MDFQRRSDAAPRAGAGAAAGQDILSVLHDLSTLLNTGLDKDQLKACVDLIEDGVGPEAVANIVKELRSRASDKP
ncbi:hypothetical protein K437DRAFT_268633 [Tilletiaria anomala UBC 951]|uniref:Mitotic-spindle organizing protein 1 n=1 Tax=Tilletiaria anomala (strain ATCC 24038 / CBS 436.72 / UBC 951) TaxID=1037660 RepID=A0A066VTX7_TILAU|nr:uncharacterized protein K437DRAFT_268633 [Tilletiaria anomala UBC 951]KDN44906.1 hypothetical protein K437DRAFT_268633 [Tilletiaria anomala UBC 951]